MNHLPEMVTVGKGRESTEVTVFPDGEFLRVDSFEHETAVVWTTGVNLSELVGLIRNGATPDRAGAVLIRAGSDSLVEVSSDAAIALILDRVYNDIGEVWLPFAEFTFSWGRSSDAGRAEAALIFVNSSDVPDAALIEKTASRSIRESARRILARSAIVSAQF